MKDLYVRQLSLGPMKNFVYLLGDAASPEVLVVDPAWDVAAIERAAAEDGKTVAAAFVSHCHHDHVNGLPELLRARDVPVYAQKEELLFSPELRGLGDCLKGLGAGEEFSVGGARFKALHTPGHTPGSHCLLCDDVLVSGDTVFVNACGRCDLKGGDPDELYRSLTQVIGKLPDQTRLLPGHDYGDVKISSLGRERQNNPYFRFADLEEFTRYRMGPRR